MLWSLFKFVLFITAIAGLAVGAGYLMEADGGLRISMADQEFTLQPLQAVIALLLLLIALWLVLKLLGFLSALLRLISGDETALTRWFDRNRERRGFEALSDSMLALASGDGHLAMTKAARAERYLDRPELTNLLTAQAAEMTGDTRKAEDGYKRLLSDDRTRFLGVRGLMQQRLAAGDTEVALKLAENAFALKPKHRDTGDILLKLQTERGDWTGARKTLGAKLKHGALPRDVYRRRDAVLALGQAEDVFTDGSSIEAREQAIEANRLSPDLIPAAVLAAQGYVAQGKPRYADRVLRKAWAVQPHPDLAAAYAATRPDEGHPARLKRFGALIKGNPDHPEAAMAMTELHLAAEDFPAARQALGDFAESDPTARSLTLMAAITRGEGADDAVVRGWLTRAVAARRGPQWLCDNCQTVHTGWVPVCDNCGAFDTLSWREAQGAAGKPQTIATDMLPLLAGRDTPRAEPVPGADLVVVSEEAQADPSAETTDSGDDKPDAPPRPAGS